MKYEEKSSIENGLPINFEGTKETEDASGRK